MVEVEPTQANDAAETAASDSPETAPAANETPETAANDSLETVADDAPETVAGDTREEAPAAPSPDWSDVRGFQVLSTASADQAADPEARATELGKELAARSARFAQSVDESIVLASDGVIRWLGDPIARLVGGDDILKPRGVLLADDALTGDSREAVEKRLALWIAAHVRKLLGPLEALGEPDAVSEHARDLAQRIVQALGVLERERVRQQVKNLDQNARSTLRKLGVRFGSLYIYAPALLKPGARTLCSQLWGLRRGVEPGSERLLAFAASGRTSFAAEAPLSSDTYRVAGFRLCGDRVVRVDIVERLTDLIRAAIPDHMRPGGRTPPEAYGFVVSPQMTSLTGCAGESFASILRSLGYESHRVTRAAFEAATRKAPTQPIAPPVVPREQVMEARSDQAEPTPADGGTAAPEGEPEQLGTGPALEASDISENQPELEPPPSGEASLESEPAETSEGAPEEPLVDPDVTEAASAHEEGSDEPELADILEGAPENPVVAVSPMTSEPEAEPTASEDDSPSTSEPAGEEEPVGEIAPVSAAPISETAGDVTSPNPESDEIKSPPVMAAGDEATVLEAAPAAEEEWIEIWRPAPRRRPQAAPRPAESDAAQRPRHSRRDSHRNFPRDRDAAPAPAVASAPAPSAENVASESPRRGGEAGRHDRGEARRQQRYKPQRSEEGRQGEAPRATAEPVRPPPPKKEPRPQTVDMDSPFAKLLALKPLLERRDKRS